MWRTFSVGRAPTTMPTMTEEHGKDGLPIIAFADDGAWERWLEQHHGDTRGVWLKLAKQASGIASVTYAEAVRTALCFGWIDGQARSLDDTRYVQRFTPRGPRSKWSQVNRTRVAELVDTGRMREAGLAAVQQAKDDGRWDRAYPPPSTATVPDDLRAALDAVPAAAEAFASLSGQNRYAVLYRVHEPKRPETRARRIQQFVEMLARGETPHP